MSAATKPPAAPPAPADALTQLIADEKKQPVASPAKDAKEGKDAKKRRRKDDEAETEEEEVETKVEKVAPKRAARAPRGSNVKSIFEAEIKVLKNDLEHLKIRLEEREREVGKLEKQLAEERKLLQDERAESKRFYQTVDGYKTSQMADLTHHMVKAHHTAMQTIQTSQEMSAQVIGSALGKSITRLKEKGNKMKTLMPPMPDLKQPNARQIYHQRVAEYLTGRVRDVDAGAALLKEVDAAIADTQQTIDEESKRLSTTLTPQELTDLQGTIEEEKTRILALKYQRDMLADGLAKCTPPKPTPSPTPTPTPTPTPIATPAPIAAPAKK